MSLSCALCHAERSGCQFLINNSVEFYKINRVTDGFFNIYIFLIRSVEIQFVVKLLNGLGDFWCFSFVYFRGKENPNNLTPRVRSCSCVLLENSEG